MRVIHCRSIMYNSICSIVLLHLQLEQYRNTADDNFMCCSSPANLQTLVPRTPKHHIDYRMERTLGGGGVTSTKPLPNNTCMICTRTHKNLWFPPPTYIRHSKIHPRAYPTTGNTKLTRTPPKNISQTFRKPHTISYHIRQVLGFAPLRTTLHIRTRH